MQDGGAIDLKDTIVANNPSEETAFLSALFSLGNNLDGDGTCNLAPGLGDLVSTDPRLGPLADNGGPTETHALLAGSPAIDAGSDDCPPPATDQRGVARPDGAACDIGAFEWTIIKVAKVKSTPTPAPNLGAILGPILAADSRRPTNEPAASIRPPNTGNAGLVDLER